MEPLSCFGQTSGMTTCSSTSFQGYTPMPKTRKSLWPNSLLRIKSRISSIFLCRLRRFRNMNNCSSSSSSSKYHLKQRTLGNTLGGGHSYTPSKFYHLPYKSINPPSSFVWIWGSKCSNKLKVFSWLLMMDRLNVRRILRRKKFKLEYTLSWQS
jgi:hypothetical protein